MTSTALVLQIFPSVCSCESYDGAVSFTLSSLILLELSRLFWGYNHGSRDFSLKPQELAHTLVLLWLLFKIAHALCWALAVATLRASGISSALSEAFLDHPDGCRGVPNPRLPSALVRWPFLAELIFLFSWLYSSVIACRFLLEVSCCLIRAYVLAISSLCTLLARNYKH